MADEKPVVEHNISSALQEGPSVTESDDVKPCVSNLVLHRDVQSATSNIFNNLQKNISESVTKVFDHTDTSTFVLQEKQEVDNEITEFKTEITFLIEQPPNISDNIQEMDNDIREFKTEIDLPEEETEIPDTSSNMLGNISESETKVFDHTDTSTFVLQKDNEITEFKTEITFPIEEPPNISDNIQEVDNDIKEFKTEIIIEENELEIPNTFSNKQEIGQEFKREITYIIEQPRNISDNIQEVDNDITEFKTEIVLQEEETEIPDTFNNIPEKSTEIGVEEELCYSEKYLKRLLTKKQDAVKKQRTRIKTLQQKVRRLQSRNKSLEAILKSYQNKKSIPKPFTD